MHGASPQPETRCCKGLLTPPEMVGGQTAWALFADLFPEWAFKTADADVEEAAAVAGLPHGAH